VNINDMRASWLEAVANGEAEGFSRHFVPDILDEVERLSRPSPPPSSEMREAMDAGYGEGVIAAESMAVKRIGELEGQVSRLGKELIVEQGRTRRACAGCVCECHEESHEKERSRKG